VREREREKDGKRMEKSEAEPVARGLGYFLKWQTPVCALIIVIPAVVAAILIRKRFRRTYEPLNFNNLWVPCWRKLHPRWLLIYRTLVFFTMAWLLYHMVLLSGLFAFYFYTQ